VIRLRIGLLLSALGAAWLASFAGCSDDSHDGETHVEGLGDVVYEGGATDEALEALLAQERQQDPTKAAVFDWPSNGEVLGAATPSPFCWHVGAATGAVTPPADRFFGVPSGAPDRREPSTIERVLFPGIPEAHAHGTPISGPAYLIEFTGPDGAMLLRGFTTATNFLPSADAWADLKAAAVPITASVTWAEFETNRIAPGGGPWAGTAITVEIKPE
jgi:hypothetical protein